MAKILLEYQGFLRFVNKAQKEVVSWFGPHCNYEPNKIMIMSAREWDAMSDEERRYFIRAEFLNSRQNESKPPTGNNSFLSFMLHRRFATAATEPNNNHDQPQQSFDPRAANAISQMYKELPQEERDKYSSKSLVDLSIEHVLEKRAKLHELYNPKELNYLEYIIKTSPKPPRNSRIWYSTLKKLSLTDANTKDLWGDMPVFYKRFYQDCAALDKKRYKFERSAWITKLLTLDFEKDEHLTISDFVSERAKSNLEALKSIIDLNKELSGSRIQVKPPKLTPFTLFMKDVGADSTFELGKFRRLAQCWSDLSEKERVVYAEKSKEIKSAYQRQMGDCGDGLFDICSVSDPLFKHTKSTCGPTKPSHLVPNKLEKVEDYYGRLKKIPKGERESAWRALPEQDKNFHIENYKQKMKAAQDSANKISSRFDYIEELIDKAMELEKLKRDLKLVRNRRTTIKNLYPQINPKGL